MRETVEPATSYRKRIVDEELDELLAALPALSIEGPRGVGKTSTAGQRGGSLIALDDPATFEIVGAQPARVIIGTPPVVIDEWQRYPASWDLVRRAVDRDRSPGRFILTGSATPTSKPTHSGAGRIVTVRMRPLTLAERGTEVPTVSMADLLSGDRPALTGETRVGLEEYTTEILAGGFPGMRLSSDRARRSLLDGYIERIVDTDLSEVGVEIRRPDALRRWLRAYAAATATTASYDRIRDAATSGEDAKPAKSTTIPYRDALERIWLLDPLPAWLPTNSHLARLTAAPRHHLADPALAARLVGVDSGALLRGKGPTEIRRDGTFLGALFESLATLSVRVFAQAGEARVAHFRTKAGEREVDLIVYRGDQRIVAIEVKLAASVHEADVRHLTWMRDQIGEDFADGIVVTTGRHAYRRADGIGVVPLALLGP
ncbi:MAG: ATP-binding protein [Acidimicrobiales bacterium]